jgi:membrane protease YdiL (CAAX protease family)
VAELEAERYLLYSLAIIATVLAIPAILLTFEARRIRLFPRQRRVALPWDGVDVCVAFGIYFFWALFFGAAFGQFDTGEKPVPSVSPAIAAQTFYVPVALGTILLSYRFIKGVRFYQLGLTWSRWRLNLALGYWFWLVFTPAVLFFHALVEKAYVAFSGRLPAAHPITKALENQPTSLTWFLIFFQAVIVAPLMEEFLFRSVLQRWLAENPNRILTVFTAALGFAVLGSDSGGAWPFVFVLAMLPGYYLVLDFFRKRSLTDNGAGAIYGSAVLFASLHSGVWPTPVPLFVLGVALGYLALRTRSLIGPVTLHGLFNAVSCLALALSHGEPDNGKPITSAANRPEGAAISTIVPGFSCPRLK